MLHYFQLASYYKYFAPDFFPYKFFLKIRKIVSFPENSSDNLLNWIKLGSKLHGLNVLNGDILFADM